MNKKIRIILTFFSCLIINTLIINAKEAAFVERFNINPTLTPENQSELGSAYFSYHPIRSSYYEFFDENNNYNIVYELNYDVENYEDYLGWIKLDNNFNIISEKKIKKTLNIYGNALYYNNYLYVVYGQIDNDTYDDTLTNYATTVTIGIAKYDKNGNIIKQIELPGYETSATYNSYYNDKTSQSLLKIRNDGTRIPFSSANVDLAVSNGIIRIDFGRQMYNGHQSSFSMLIDSNLNYLNRPSAIDLSTSIYTNYNHELFTSHSFDQKLIGTSDNGFLSVYKVDGNPERGFRVSKAIITETSATTYRYTPFHFREGAKVSYGYNNTFADLGNIIEVSDGYILVGDSENTLSLNFAYRKSANQSRNIFIQKYSKDFKNKTNQTISTLNTSIRSSETSRTDITPEGSSQIFLFLNENGEKDYGVKWLTNYNNEKTVREVRAVKSNDNEIVIIWAESNSSGENDTFDVETEKKYYYMIIDNFGNIIKEPLEIEGSTPSTLNDYVIKDNYIYWTFSKDGKVTVNRLNIQKNDTELIFEPVGSTNLTHNDINNNTMKLSVKNNKGSIYWRSNDETIATVDQTGLVTFKEKNGTVRIYVNNIDYGKSIYYEIKVNYGILEIIPSSRIIELPPLETTSFKITVNPSVADKSNIDWIVMDETIAKITNVTTNGIITIKGLKKGSTIIEGRGKIPCGDAYSYTKIKVNVVNTFTDIIVNNTYQNMFTGETLQLEYDTIPVTATESIIFETDSENITVNKNGLVTALSSGEARVRIKGATGNITRQVVINIEDKQPISTDIESYQFNNLNETYAVKSYQGGSLTTNVNYKSSNESVATINNSNGIITSKKGGFTTVTVENRHGSSNIYIYVSKIIELPNGKVGYVGDVNFDGILDTTDGELIKKLTQEGYDENLKELIDINGDNIIDIEDYNYFTNILKYNFTTNGFNPITRIDLINWPDYVRLNTTTRLAASIYPTDTTDKKNLTIKSSDESVLTVDANGKMKAVSLGSATITVTASNGITASKKITVLEKNISFENKNIYMSKGSKLKLTPRMVYNSTLNWGTSNKSVATVDDEGVVTALEKGTVMISVLNASGASDYVTITIGDTLLGDINQDGTVDNKDVFLAIKVILKIVPNDSNYLIGGDTNLDNKITNTDVMYMIKKILKII